MIHQFVNSSVTTERLQMNNESQAPASSLRTNNSSELAAIANARHGGKKIVFTNGCFDLLHVGHVRFLTEARSLGDFLVVAINSDQSVRELKGPARPVIPESERRERLLALKPVDFVCVFGEPTPAEIIELVEPDILVKGGDWPVDQIVGHEFVNARGGRTLSLRYDQGHSTTDIVGKILATLEKK
jgi:rfaE bifunctional protein nucleotidyltransferase chain/domain